MNRRYQPKNQMLYNSFNFSKNNYSSFKPTYRRQRLNKRFIPIARRNRLQRVQNIINYANNFRRPYQQREYNNVNNVNNNANNNNAHSYNSNNNANENREIYVKGLPRYLDDLGLFNLFKKEGMIINCNILYDNVGFSRGTGRILFANFKDAVNVIKKWNDIEYKGNTLKVEYKVTKNVDNKNEMYNANRNGNNNRNSRKNYYMRPFNFTQANHYSNKFKTNYYYNNNNYNGYNRYRHFNNNNNY